MANVIFPLQSYQEKSLERLIKLFPRENTPFVSGLAIGKSQGGLRERISRQLNGFSKVSKTDSLDQFKEDAHRSKTPFNICHCTHAEFPDLIANKSMFADFIFHTSCNEMERFLATYHLSAPVLFSAQFICETRFVLIPVFDDTCVKLLKQFVQIFPHFLKTRNVIVMGLKPDLQSEIQKEKYLVEFLRTQIPKVSYCWFDSYDCIKKMEGPFASSDNPILLIIPKSRINDVKSYLNKDCVSIFTGN